MCNLSDNIQDYYFVAQGKTTIPNVDDGEECLLTDVRTDAKPEPDEFNFCIFFNFSSTTPPPLWLIPP